MIHHFLCKKRLLIFTVIETFPSLQELCSITVQVSLMLLLTIKLPSKNCHFFWNFLNSGTRWHIRITEEGVDHPRKKPPCLSFGDKSTTFSGHLYSYSLAIVGTRRVFRFETIDHNYIAGYWKTCSSIPLKLT